MSGLRHMMRAALVIAGAALLSACDTAAGRWVWTAPDDRDSTEVLEVHGSVFDLGGLFGLTRGWFVHTTKRGFKLTGQWELVSTEVVAITYSGVAGAGGTSLCDFALDLDSEPHALSLSGKHCDFTDSGRKVFVRRGAIEERFE